MTAADQSPLRVSRDQRRELLSRHFIAIVEPWLEAGDAYGDISVERLTTTGKISRSTFYSYFDDKGDLLRAMAVDVIADLATEGDAWWTLAEDADQEGLKSALSRTIDVYRAHRFLLGAIVEASAYDPRVHAEHSRLVSDSAAALASHIQQRQQAGISPAELDAPRIAKWILWMLERGMYTLVAPADDTESSLLVDAVTDIVWRTLYLPVPA